MLRRLQRSFAASTLLISSSLRSSSSSSSYLCRPRLSLPSSHHRSLSTFADSPASRPSIIASHRNMSADSLNMDDAVMVNADAVDVPASSSSSSSSSSAPAVKKRAPAKRKSAASASSDVVDAPADDSSSSSTSAPAAKKARAPRKSAAKSASVSASSSGDAIDDADASSSSSPVKKKRAPAKRKSAAVASASSSTSNDVIGAPPSIGDASSSAVDVADDDDAPVAKKGRKKATKKVKDEDEDEKDEDETAKPTPKAKSPNVKALAASSSSTIYPAAVAASLLEVAKLAARPADSLTIMSWNVNGLRAALKNGANSYFDHMDADIICLGEVKADADTVREFNHVGEGAADADADADGADQDGSAKKKKSVASSAIGMMFAKKVAGADSSSSSASAASASEEKKQPKKAQKYHKYWNCATKKGYSGVAILTKVKPISVRLGIGIAKHDDEGRALTAEFDSFYLLNTYVPNSGDGLVRLDYRTNEWDVDLLAYINTLQKTKPVIWTGDLNVAHHDTDVLSTKGKNKVAGFTPAERQRMSETLGGTNGLVDVYHNLYPTTVEGRFTFWGFRSFGRVTNSGWRLDYYIVSSSLMPRIVDMWVGSELTHGVSGTRRSDHAPIFLNIRK